MIYNALSQMKAKNLGPGKYADGQGLWLIKRSKQAGKWIQRLYVDGKRRDMGLGRWPDVSIAEAREKANLAAENVRVGYERARKDLGHVNEDLNDYVRDNPARSVLIAAGIGFVLGLILRGGGRNDF